MCVCMYIISCNKDIFIDIYVYILMILESNELLRSDP